MPATMLRPRRVLPVFAALATAVVSTGLGATSAAANDEVVSVSTIGELQSATGSCAGTNSEPTTIKLAADIADMTAEVFVGCHVVLDLSGHHLDVRNVWIADAQALTIKDTGVDGTLIADASENGFEVAGIRNTNATLTIDGGTVTATGSYTAAGIGGEAASAGGTTIVNGGTVTATGGMYAAGIGSGLEKPGGITIISGGTVTAAGGAQGGAGVGGGSNGQGGTTTISGGTVTATADYSDAAGIGGGWHGHGGTTTISGGTVTASGSWNGSGIGGGMYGQGGTTTISGGTVSVRGGHEASGIGGGNSGAGGTTTITDGTLSATGGTRGAGIGGGRLGNGGTTTISGGTVTATGSDGASGIGGGYNSAGGATTIEGGTVTATGGFSAVGPGDGSNVFGSLSINGGVLRVPSGFLRVPDSAAGAEIIIGPDGVLDGSAGPDATYTFVAGAGQIDNGGRVLLPTGRVTSGGVTVSDRHYLVGFDTQGGSTAPEAVTVFADTFDHGNRTFPPDPTKAGVTFTGWNTAADGTGDPITADSALPGSSATGTAVPVTAYAQWQAAPTITGIAPSSGPVDGGTEVVITGTDFTGATVVDFGNTGPATSFTVDSPTQITAVSPQAASAVTRHIRVTTPGGASPAVAADRFTYTVPAPAVTGIAPSSGPVAGGTEVVITGTDFTGATQVRFGTAGAATSFTVDSPTQITATAPVSATTGLRHIRVTTPGGTTPAVAADRFTYTAPAPAVTGIAPSSGPLAGGTEVVITGTGFTDATKVVFGTNGEATGFTVDSDTQITAIAPSSTTSMTRHVRITTPNGGISPAVTEDRYTWR